MENIKHILIIIVLFLSIIGGIVLLINYLKKKRTIENKIQESLRREADVQMWFDEQVNIFEKDSLAYGIDKECDKLDISVFVKDKLRDKYGKVLIEPMLLVYNDYTKKYGSNSEYLEKAIDNWLKKNSIENNQEEKPLEQIEKFILSRSYEKAKSIVSESANK